MSKLIIELTSQQQARLAKALGAHLVLNQGDEAHTPRDATAAEMKDYIIEHLRQIVQKQEKREAMLSVAQPAAFDPS